MGTEFTAAQSIYPEIIRDTCTGARPNAIGATALERRIARFEAGEDKRAASLTVELRSAIETADVVVMACTCFPLVRDELETSFPGVLFLDPGAYCAELLSAGGKSADNAVSLRVTGDEVSPASVVNFANTYLGVTTCCI